MLNWMTERNERRPDSATGAAARTRAPLPDARGIVAGTRIATADGWRRAETLCAGDIVMTFDNGAQPLRSVSRRLCPGPGAGDAVAQPLIVLAPGVAGNGGTLLMLPGQPILFESDVAESLYGDPFALVPARSMSDLPEVSSMLSETPVVAVSLWFDADEIVYADGQAMLYCEASGASEPATLDEAVFGPQARYAVLPLADARRLVEATERAGDAPDRGAPFA
jgi:hypothetical protein